jgi:hypothetical protein
MIFPNKTKSNVSLSYTGNYNIDLTVSVEEVMNKYTEVIAEYLNFILEHVNIKKFEHAAFTISRGFDTITHIFINMLYYTRNLDLTYSHCQKAFYLYIEFICQISEAEKQFLHMNSRDSAAYVYRKTLFEINSDYIKKMDDCSQTTKEKFDQIAERIAIDKFLVSYIINSAENVDPYISPLADITTTLNSIPLSKPALQTLRRIVDILYTNITSISEFYTTIELLTKKILTNQFDLNCDVNKICDVITESPNATIDEWFKKP